jgi:flagellar hook assembly protein FlgD
MQNRPSPFEGSTVIEFGLPKAAEVSLAIFDVSGRQVATLAEGVHEAGYHQVTWTGSRAGGDRVSPGVYFYRLVTGYNVLTRKMLVVK